MANIHEAIAKLTKVGWLAEAISETTIVGGLSWELIRLAGAEGKIYHDQFRISRKHDTWTAIMDGPGMYNTVLQASGTLDQAVTMICKLHTVASPIESLQEINGQEA